MIKHNHSKRGQMTNIYHSWQDMIFRCNNLKGKDYSNYGQRGIKVCDRWLKFENFLKDMGEPLTKKHSLDRINNDGDYCPDNCRWATRKQQGRNRRNNNLITAFGKTQCLSAWSEEFNISWETLYARIYRYNWSIHKALTIPVKNKNIRKDNNILCHV